MGFRTTIADDEINLLSVGIDVGSSTSHLVFSRIKLVRDERSYSRRFVVDEREVLYNSEIIDTPLIDPETIDVEKVVEFFRGEYQKAGIDRGDVQSGVVIVTGETAKKKNANEIVHLLAEDAGSFVAATAGPNFESVIAAFGSGAVERSHVTNAAVVSCDIGGGTSNIAVTVRGDVVSTACTSVGGRLIAFNEKGEITRIDGPARKVLDFLGLEHDVGSKMSQEEIRRVCQVFADVLYETLSGEVVSELGKELLMTDSIEIPQDLPLEFTFSGGVSEMIFSERFQDYKDIGATLGEVIRSRFDQLPGTVFEPENKIRATVIGAGCYTLQVSGSTCFLDDDTLSFPIRNIPVVRVDVDRNRLSEDYVVDMIDRSLRRFDLRPGQDVVALSFEDPVRASYSKLRIFARGVEKAMTEAVTAGHPIILIFKRDIGNSVGNVIRRETNIKDNLVSLDEVEVNEGDWIDIGAPLINGQVVPITVKSLIFSRDK